MMWNGFVWDAEDGCILEMSKLADARGLNIYLAWREHICLCYRIVI